MTDVFISYSKKHGLELADVLEAHGFSIWIDKAKIKDGHKWWNEILGGIQRADNVIFIVSEEALCSSICHLELYHASQAGKRIIPVIFGGIDFSTFKAAVPEYFAKMAVKGPHPLYGDLKLMTVVAENWQVLNSINWTMSSEPDSQNFFEAITRTLKDDHDYVERHTTLLIRALEWEKAQQRPSSLLIGDDLRDAETWIAPVRGKHPKASDLHHRYISASSAAARTRTRRFQALSVMAAVLIAIGISAGILAADRVNAVIAIEATLTTLNERLVVQEATYRQIAGQFNDAGVVILAQSNDEMTLALAKVYFEVIRELDAIFPEVRTPAAQSITLYNLGMTYERNVTTPDYLEQAITAYMDAIEVNPANIQARYALSSLLLIRYPDDPDRLSTAIEIAQTGYEDYISPAYCSGMHDLTTEAIFQPTWHCFALMVTEIGALVQQNAPKQQVEPLLERAVAIAVANDQFRSCPQCNRERRLYFTAEAYYYLALVTEPETDEDVLCQIIRNVNLTKSRHEDWYAYANGEMEKRGSYCLPG